MKWNTLSEVCRCSSEVIQGEDEEYGQSRETKEGMKKVDIYYLAITGWDDTWKGFVLSPSTLNSIILILLPSILKYHEISNSYKNNKLNESNSVMPPKATCS